MLHMNSPAGGSRVASSVFNFAPKEQIVNSEIMACGYRALGEIRVMVAINGRAKRESIYESFVSVYST